MKRYYYYIAHVFDKNVTNCGTVSSVGGFDVAKVMSDVAETFGISPLKVAVTFFSEISKEAFENFGKLATENK